MEQRKELLLSSIVQVMVWVWLGTQWCDALVLLFSPVESVSLLFPQSFEDTSM